MTSWGSRLVRSWRKRLREPGRQPKQAVQRRRRQAEQSLAGGGVDGERQCFGVDRLLQAGRGFARRGGQGRCEAEDVTERRCCSSKSTKVRAMVVVLPVPGPPAMTVKRRNTATAAASRCRSADRHRRAGRDPSRS